MIAATTDAIRWAADAAGLALITILPDGPELNEAATHAAGIAAPRDLRTAIAVIVHADPSELAIGRIVAATEANARAVELIGSPASRIVVIPSPGGGAPVQVLIAPAHLAQSAEIQRRAAVADLAAGAAHELANSLGAIAGWAELARTADAQQAHDALVLIESSARNARGAARSLLGAVSGAERASDGPVDVGALGEEALKLIRPVAQRTGVSVDVLVEPGLFVCGQVADVWTIVSNLAHNAIEAQPEGGAVRIVVASSPGLVRLTVADDGPGMEEAARRRAFEPYYTTKTHGTGLGLALVRRGVDALGGSIAIASRPGEGTMVQIELPRLAHTGESDAADTPPAARAPRVIAATRLNPPAGMPNPPAANVVRGLQTPTQRSRRSGVREAPATRTLVSRVLVVDDDASIAALIETALTLRGATVTVARSGAEALAAPGPFDVAIVDLTLPDIRGDALLARLRERGSVRAAAIASGTEPPAKVAANGTPDAWLRKPFELDDLASLVRVLLKPPKKQRARRG